MSLRRIKWIAVLCLCLYGAALAHQLLPHVHAHDDDAATCGLCVLVFGAILAVAAVMLAVCCQPAAVYVATGQTPRVLHLCRSLQLRGPPFMSAR